MEPKTIQLLILLILLAIQTIRLIRIKSKGKWDLHSPNSLKPSPISWEDHNKVRIQMIESGIDLFHEQEKVKQLTKELKEQELKINHLKKLQRHD